MNCVDGIGKFNYVSEIFFNVDIKNNQKEDLNNINNFNANNHNKLNIINFKSPKIRKVNKDHINKKNNENRLSHQIPNNFSFNTNINYMHRNNEQIRNSNYNTMDNFIQYNNNFTTNDNKFESVNICNNFSQDNRNATSITNKNYNSHKLNHHSPIKKKKVLKKKIIAINQEKNLNIKDNDIKENIVPIIRKHSKLELLNFDLNDNYSISKSDGTAYSKKKFKLLRRKVKPITNNEGSYFI